ncbi:MAG TPA: hypothetical protein VKZ63_04505 [Kofleriaceae bacterium]|nr:hypothetical protein [Kofleriaceae bacterium]
MRRLARALGLAAALTGALACGGGDDDDDMVTPPDDAGPGYLECTGSDQAFVRQATLAILGRRPRSQAEVNVYADLMAGVRALAEGGADAGAASAPDPREVVVRALIDSDPDAFVDRWSEHVMDALRVPRIEDQSQATCYGEASRVASEGIRDGALARAVRERAPDGGEVDGGRFTMLDLLRSSLHLDDLSVVYRAHLFALVSRPIPAANVPMVQAELARREDFGLVFDAAYLNRDLVCLGCHNSEGSVTYHPDPELNRHWSMPGHFETAIYGASTGIAPERAHAAFRFVDLVVEPFGGGGGVVRPWGWDSSCGRFDPTGLPPDPAGVDGHLASLRGDRLTVFDLEAALRRGFDSLAQDGLQIGPDGSIADPDAALAYLVAASIAEGVWREVIGTPLTIANYFPRNEAARDVLIELTAELVASGYSLRELLVAILLSPYFNRPPPEAGCGDGPYDMPAIYDPWVTSDADPARRGNGSGDAVVPLSPRVLLRAAQDALEWPRPYYYAFPEEPFSVDACQEAYTCRQMETLCRTEGACCTAYQLGCADPLGPGEPSASRMRAFERGIGVFLKHGERGFRGLDFQARLVWEDVFGACRNQSAPDDFIAALVSRAQSGGATVGDVVAALKDRLIGEARVSEEPVGGTSERAAVVAIVGPLDAQAAEVADLEARARALCGVLLSSPQFLLTGIAAPDAREVPRLTPDQARYPAVCAAVAERDLHGDLSITCDGDALTVSR